MPKLSRAKLEARREHILRAASACFDRQGFHRTTIADVRREAGVSTGAIYTYFPHKEAMIRAMLENAQRTRRTQLEEAARRPGGPHSERAVLLSWAERVFSDEGVHVARINVNLWAEALRDRAVAGLAQQSLANATRAVADVVTREVGRRLRAQPGSSARDMASVLVAIHLGMEVQRAVGMKLDAKGILRVLDELFPTEAAESQARVARKSSKARATVKRRVTRGKARP